MDLRENLGCGRNAMAEWVNVDAVALPGVDVVADLDRCRTMPLPFADDSADAFLLSHVIEHLRDPLALMQESHRIARPGALATVRSPYGSSNDADEDPTHVRRMFVQSFGCFSQPCDWRGDWRPRRVTLHVARDGNAGLAPREILDRVHALRNVVFEMVAELEAVKPQRATSHARGGRTRRVAFSRRPSGHARRGSSTSHAELPRLPARDASRAVRSSQKASGARIARRARCAHSSALRRSPTCS